MLRHDLYDKEWALIQSLLSQKSRASSGWTTAQDQQHPVTVTYERAVVRRDRTLRPARDAPQSFRAVVWLDEMVIPFPMLARALSPISKAWR
jgi:hypothetical protein